MEIILFLAFLHYWIGVSLDNSRQITNFFTGLNPEVEPTNNRSERNVRREAEIRKGVRTSKTVRGAKRRGTIVTVLARLQTRISNFTLSNVLAEIERWLETGRSLFQEELQAIHTDLPSPAAAR